MTITIEISDKEHKNMYKNLAKDFIPKGHEIKAIYPTIGQIVIGKIEE